jgi:hypothetical protein
MRPERRNQMLAFSLAVLTTVTIILAFVKAGPRDHVDRDLFKVANPDEIDKVILRSATDTVVLTYGTRGWTVNDSFPADGNMVRVLFATLMQHEVKRPLARVLKDSVVAMLTHEGVNVQLMSAGKKVKEFVAGGNPAKTKAYFMDETGEVYHMAIPGYRVYVSGIYELSANGFRNKYVFAFKWANFKAMEVSFPAKPADNFRVSLQKDYYTIEGMPKVDTARLATFLRESSVLTVDEYAETAFDTASLTPLIDITVFDIADRTYPLRVYKEEKNGKFPGMAGREPAFFRSEDIRSILRPRSFFIKK